MKAWCASVMYVNVKGVDLGAFRYIFGIHMLHNIYPRCRIPCGILYLQFFYTLFLAHIFFIFIFLLYYIEFQSVNIKDKVPTNKQNNNKKKPKLWCIICSQPISLISRTILGWLYFFFFSFGSRHFPHPRPVGWYIVCYVCCFSLGESSNLRHNKNKFHLT